MVYCSKQTQMHELGRDPACRTVSNRTLLCRLSLTSKLSQQTQMSKAGTQHARPSQIKLSSAGFHRLASSHSRHRGVDKPEASTPGHSTSRSALQAYIKTVELLIDLASLQTAFLTLDQAIKTTNRRVNALDNVVRPRLENTIAYIKVRSLPHTWANLCRSSLRARLANRWQMLHLALGLLSQTWACPQWGSWQAHGAHPCYAAGDGQVSTVAAVG